MIKRSYSRWFLKRRNKYRTILFPIVVCLLCGLLILELRGLRSLQVVTKQKIFWIYPDNNSADIQEHGSSNVKPLNTFLMNEACQENKNEVFSEFETIQLLFVVKSHILNIGKREAIRRTWGNVKELHVKTVFVVGYLQNMDTFADFETKRYKDIIRMKMEDKYENIVYKTIYSVLCLSGLNIKAEFVHIVDDDRLVNALNVYDIAMKSIAQSEIAMIGFMVYLSRPDRKDTSKNYISWEDYPFLYFPSYIIGGTILTNMKTIHQLAKAVEYVRIVQIEDVFIGMVATAFKIDMRHHSGFSPFKQPVHLLKNTLSSPGYETAYLLLRDWKLMRRWNTWFIIAGKSIKRKQIRVTNLNQGKHINYKRKTTEQMNSLKTYFKRIVHPNFYGDVVYRTWKFRYDPGKLNIPLNKLILKGYKFNTVIRYLNIVLSV